MYKRQDWKNYQELDARLAFTLTPANGQSHVGVVTLQMQSTVNMDDHTVFLSNPQVTSVSFPSLDPATTAQMNELMKTFLNPSATMTISLDRLVASVKKGQMCIRDSIKGRHARGRMRKKNSLRRPKIPFRWRLSTVLSLLTAAG